MGIRLWRRKQLRESYYVIPVLANVSRVNLLTSFLAHAEIEPRVSFERYEAVLANPGQPASPPAAGKDKVVIRIIEQDCGQT